MNRSIRSRWKRRRSARTEKTEGKKGQNNQKIREKSLKILAITWRSLNRIGEEVREGGRRRKEKGRNPKIWGIFSFVVFVLLICLIDVFLIDFYCEFMMFKLVILALKKIFCLWETLEENLLRISISLNAGSVGSGVFHDEL